MKKVKIRRVQLWPESIKSKDDKLAMIAIVLAAALLLAFVIGILIGQIVRLQALITEIEAQEIVQAQEPEARLQVRQLKATPTAVPTEEPEVGLPLPDPARADGSFKTYMDYRKITRTDSAQYQLQQLARTDADGFRRYQHYYLVAVGTAFSKTIGETFDITLSNGETKHYMIGDVKADEHTDPSNRYIPINGNIIEFIVDTQRMDPEVLTGGDISPLGFQGAVVRILPTEYSEVAP